jgi:hypothetical protein
MLKLLYAYWRDVAWWHRPALLVFDDLDKLLPAETEVRDQCPALHFLFYLTRNSWLIWSIQHAPSQRSRQLAALFASAFGPGAHAIPRDVRGVIMLATAQARSSLHPSVAQGRVFMEVVNLSGLDRNARRDVRGLCWHSSGLVGDGCTNKRGLCRLLMHLLTRDARSGAMNTSIVLRWRRARRAMDRVTYATSLTAPCMLLPLVLLATRHLRYLKLHLLPLSLLTMMLFYPCDPRTVRWSSLKRTSQLRRRALSRSHSGTCRLRRAVSSGPTSAGSWRRARSSGRRSSGRRNTGQFSSRVRSGCAPGAFSTGHIVRVD